MSIQIRPVSGFVMATCENLHTKIWLSVELTPDEARQLARELSVAADEADHRPLGTKIGRSAASSSPTPASHPHTVTRQGEPDAP